MANALQVTQLLCMAIEADMRSLTSGNKEASEDKVKAPAQKGPVLQKGRFSVTSDDADFEVISCLQ